MRGNKILKRLTVKDSNTPHSCDYRYISSKSWKSLAGIQKTLGVCGGDACIGLTRIPVWVLVNARNIGISESQLLKDYPTLSASDLANAWFYASMYPEEIALAIKENEEA